MILLEKSEMKKRFKMYKAGKAWVVAPLVFFGLAAGLSANVKAVAADTVSQAQKTTVTAAASSQSKPLIFVCHKNITGGLATRLALCRTAGLLGPWHGEGHLWSTDPRLPCQFVSGAACPKGPGAHLAFHQLLSGKPPAHDGKHMFLQDW